MAKNETPRPRFAAALHSLEAEMAVIGAVLAVPSCAFEHTEKLKADYFYLEGHRLIVEAIVELLGENVPPDFITVFERLRFKNQSERVGEFDGLRNFLEYASTPENVGYWAMQVKNYWELRLVVEKCAELAERGSKVAGANVEAFLSEAEETFARLAEARVTKGLLPASEVVRETILNLENIINNPLGITGVPSGFVDLDKVTAGFQPSDLIIIGARPAMGKTSLALNFASHAAVAAKKYVAFFSLEMSSQQLMQRLLSTAAKIHTHKFRDGRMSTPELQSLYHEAVHFNNDRLMIDDTPALSLLDMASRCRKMKRERGIDLIVVDYLQLMTVGAAGKNLQREREISMISMGLKALAKELNCPVIALAQLSRNLEQRPGDKRPRPSDLRESGSLEQDADQIFFIYRDEVYNKDSPDKNIAEVIIGKNRHGPTDTVKLAFHSEFTAFHNLAKI